MAKWSSRGVGPICDGQMDERARHVMRPIILYQLLHFIWRRVFSSLIFSVGCATGKGTQLVVSFFSNLGEFPASNLGNGPLVMSGLHRPAAISHTCRYQLIPVLELSSAVSLSVNPLFLAFHLAYFLNSYISHLIDFL